MKRILFFIMLMLTSTVMFAKTPIEELVERYQDVKGVKNIVAHGAMMSIARPMLKSYTIVPLADCVDELSSLRIQRGISDTDKKRFVSDLDKILKKYIYAGKTKSTSGIVDVYVHLESTDYADELVVYNPETHVLNVLRGRFPVAELAKLKCEV